MAWIIANADGELESIESDEPDPILTDLTGKTVTEVEVPEQYPESMKWDAATQQFVTDLTGVRTSQKAEIAAARSADLDTISTDFGVFYGDTESKVLMNGLLTAILLQVYLGATLPSTVQFKTADQGFKTFTLSEFISASFQVMGGVQTAFGVQAALEAQIDDPDATLEEIQSVVWTGV